MKREVKNLAILPIWLYIWVIFFALILILSIVAPDSDVATLVKLGGILICCLHVVVSTPRDYWLIAAMLATSLADIFLAANNISPIGIGTFIIVQICHFIHLTGAKQRKFLLIFAISAIVCITIDTIGNFVPILFILCAFYGIMLITNVVTSIKWYQKEPKNPRAICASAGFIVFFLCDFCTTISYASLVNILPSFVYSPANFFVWLFYYPSQILLSNTGKCDKIDVKGR